MTLPASDLSPSDLLITDHYALAMSYTMRWARRFGGNLWTDDLRSAAAECLINCARTYDPSHGACFITYLRYKLPYALIDRMRVLYPNSRSATPEDRHHLTVSIDANAETNHLSDQVTLRDRLEDKAAPVAVQVCDGISHEALLVAIDSLRKGDAEIAHMYFIDHMNLKAIGEEPDIQVCESRVCQRIRRIKIDLRDKLYQDGKDPRAA